MFEPGAVVRHAGAGSVGVVLERAYAFCVRPVVFDTANWSCVEFRDGGLICWVPDGSLDRVEE